MLKHILLATGMLVSVPAFAQDNAGAAKVAPGREALPPSSVASADDTLNSARESVAPAQSVAEQTVAEQKPAAPAAPAADAAVSAKTSASASAAAPVNQADQVAQVVNTEFPTYDKDSNGALSVAEFGSWMVALKSASDPSTKADSPATKTWVAQAFATADKDKSKAVTKAELTGFLTQG